MKKLVIFASGAGSNAANIMSYIKDSRELQVAAVFTNKAEAGVVERANEFNVPVITFTKEALFSDVVLNKIREISPDAIILAGFLLQVPEAIINAFPAKILNIHPALLPKYGGKGMYGMHVHNAVLTNKEQETGITIHEVDANYDEGKIIFQTSVAISDCTSAEEIARRVQELEHQHFPRVVSEFVLSR